MEQTVERQDRGQANGEDADLIAGAAGTIKDRAAGELENAAAHLRDRSVEDLMGAFDRFARQQPAAAFAGAVLAGFVMSRVIKSSG